MSRRILGVLLVLLSAGGVLGCATVARARQKQALVAGKGSDSSPADPASAVLPDGLPSLEAFVGFALTNRPEIAVAQSSLVDARLALRQMAADAPALSSNCFWTADHLSLSGGYSASSDAAHPFDELELGTRGGASASLSLDLLIWDWGRYEAAAKAQAERVIAAELAVIDSGYAVFDEVASGCFSLLERQAMLEVAQTNVAVFAEHLRQVENRLEAGEARSLDLLRARLDLSQAQEGLVAASNDVRTAEADFARALGLEATEGAVPLPADAQSGLSAAFRAFPETAFDARDAFETARTNAPSLRIARARLRAASAEVDVAIADLKPSVSASASLAWTDPLWLWNWGVSGVQTLFQGHRRRLAVERAGVALESAAGEVDRVEQTLSRDLAKALADRDNAREALETAATSVRQAKENLDLVTRRFEIGDASRVEYADSVADYIAALGSRIGAFYRGQRAEAALFPLIGVRPVYREETVSEVK